MNEDDHTAVHEAIDAVRRAWADQPATAEPCVVCLEGEVVPTDGVQRYECLCRPCIDDWRAASADVSWLEWLTNRTREFERKRVFAAVRAALFSALNGWLLTGLSEMCDRVEREL